MRVATWNINGFRARVDFLRLWLERRAPDVVGLQELKITDDEFPAELFTELGYHVATFGQKAWNGVAVLSREPIEVLDRGLAGQEDFGSRLLRVRTFDLDFTTVYCPNGKDPGHDDFRKKLEWFDSLLGYWSTRDRNARAMLCGDFNVVPGTLDTWLTAEQESAEPMFHTQSERSRFAALLELGLIDLFRARHPDKKSFSWWDYRGGAFHRGQGLRIDLVLASPAVAQRVRDVEIDRDFRKKQNGLIPSDHAPVYVNLD